MAMMDITPQPQPPPRTKLSFRPKCPVLSSRGDHSERYLFHEEAGQVPSCRAPPSGVEVVAPKLAAPTDQLPKNQRRPDFNTPSWRMRELQKLLAPSRQAKPCEEGTQASELPRPVARVWGPILDALEASKDLMYESTESAEESLEFEEDWDGDELFSESIVAATTGLMTAISDENAARARGDGDGPSGRPPSRLAEARDQLVDAEANAARERAEEEERIAQQQRHAGATRIQSSFRGRQARKDTDARRRQLQEQLVADRVRRYHETRIPRPHRYVGVPRSSLSPWPTSRPSSPGGFDRRARARRTVSSPDPEDRPKTPQDSWKTVRGMKDAQGLMSLLTKKQPEEESGDEEQEDEGVPSLTFDTTKLLADLKNEDIETQSPIKHEEAVEEIEEDELDQLISPKTPSKVKKRTRKAQPPTEKGKYKDIAKANVKPKPKPKPLLQALEPETEPPALSSTPSPGQDEEPSQEDNGMQENAEASEKAPSEASSHGPLYLAKDYETPLSPSCSNIYKRAINTLRNVVQETFGSDGPAVPQNGEELIDLVQKEYLDACNEWQVKPNSKVVKVIQTAKIHSIDASPLKPFVTTYDFGGAHMGDRGVICVLLALARDVCCSFVSLEKCALHNACAPLIAEFLKLHPSLVQVDLYSNAFSFHAGELFLKALEKRQRPRGSLHDLSAATVCVNLGETSLSKNAPKAAPCGVLWSKHGRFAPSEYGKLIDELNDTHRVRYDHVKDFGSISVPKEPRRGSLKDPRRGSKIPYK